MYNQNKAQQSKNRVHISWDILYIPSNMHTHFLCCCFIFVDDPCDLFPYIIQGCFTGTGGAIVWLPRQFQWNNPDAYGYNPLPPSNNNTREPYAYILYLSDLSI